MELLEKIIVGAIMPLMPDYCKLSSTVTSHVSMEKKRDNHSDNDSMMCMDT
jgi:hypothetical protein